MGREIKFRAWDKERKDMREIQLMDWSDWWVSTGHTWEREKGLEYGERNSFKNEETDRHILMQYTGLQDKNGREIFEWDVIRWHDVVTSNYQITFVDGVFCLDGIGIQNLYHHREELGKWEVVGNIYENPELLEV